MITVRGTDDVVSPHGVPPDLIDRLLIVRTLPYNREEIKTIISKRAAVENLQVEDEALEFLATLGTETSLRYVLQLLSPSGIIAKIANRAEISVADVEEAKLLFLDAKRSTKILEQSENYL